MLNELKNVASDAQKKGRQVIMFIAMEGWQKKGGQGDYVRELPDALRLWCRHPRLWEEAVRKIMKFNWDWSKCVPAYEKIYK